MRERSEPPQSPTIELPDGRVELSPNAVVRHDEEGRLRLDSGTIKVDIRPRPSAAPPLVFRAGDIAIRVFGTIFALHVEAGHGTVRVYEGAVMLERDGDPPRRIDASSGVTPRAPLWVGNDRAETDAWGESARARRERENASEVGKRGVDLGASAHAEVETVRKTEESHGIGPLREAEVVRPSEADRGAAMCEVETAAPLGKAEAGHAPKTISPDDSDPRRGKSHREPSTPPAAHADQRQGARSNIPALKTASAEGERREEPGDRSAELSLYREGLAALRARHPAEAAELFARYLESYPSGLLREEAQLSRLEALSRAGAYRLLEVEAEAWITRHDADPRAKEVRELLLRAEDQL